MVSEDAALNGDEGQGLNLQHLFIGLRIFGKMFSFLPSHYTILPLLHALGFEGYNLTPEKKKALLLLLIVICSVCPLDISSSTYAHNV